MSRREWGLTEDDALALLLGFLLFCVVVVGLALAGQMSVRDLIRSDLTATERVLRVSTLARLD